MMAASTVWWLDLSISTLTPTVQMLYTCFMSGALGKDAFNSSSNTSLSSVQIAARQR